MHCAPDMWALPRYKERRGRDQTFRARPHDIEGQVGPRERTQRTAGAHRRLPLVSLRPSRHCAGIELPRPARHSHATSQSCHLHLAGSPAATSSSAPTRQLPTAHSFHNALVPAASGARSAYRHGVGARALQAAAPGRAVKRPLIREDLNVIQNISPRRLMPHLLHQMVQNRTNLGGHSIQIMIITNQATT